jgi:hypothetical protein
MKSWQTLPDLTAKVFFAQHMPDVAIQKEETEPYSCLALQIRTLACADGHYFRMDFQLAKSPE